MDIDIARCSRGTATAHGSSAEVPKAAVARGSGWWIDGGGVGRLQGVVLEWDDGVDGAAGSIRFFALLALRRAAPFARWSAAYVSGPKEFLGLNVTIADGSLSRCSGASMSQMADADRIRQPTNL
ncbi:uncharacterized protein PG986_010325 [Apiospora aurea]|uniref:Uncharacterized protein n=1 Tax=Apiospora aurea TaxID=335848 RepID=A0ABR1Q1X1_9PEZI